MSSLGTHRRESTCLTKADQNAMMQAVLDRVGGASSDTRRLSERGAAAFSPEQGMNTIESTGFEDLMLQQAHLHQDIGRLYTVTVSQLQDQVRRLGARLNCALLSARTDRGEKSSDSDLESLEDSRKSCGSATSMELCVVRQATTITDDLHSSDSDATTPPSPFSPPSVNHSLLSADRATIKRSQANNDDVDISVPGEVNGDPARSSSCCPEVSKHTWITDVPDVGRRKSLPEIGMKRPSLFGGNMALLGGPSGPSRHRMQARRSWSQVVPQMSGGRQTICAPDEESLSTLSSNLMLSQPASRRTSRVLNPSALPTLLNVQGSDSVIEPWDVWYDVCEMVLSADAEDHEAKANEREKMTRMQKMRKMAKSVDFHHLEDTESLLSKVLQKLVMHPSSPNRLIWVSLGVLMVTYDLIMLPMGAFDLPFDVQMVMDVFTYVISSFWTADIILNFFTGFHIKGGSLEMRSRKTAWHYLHTWFIVDIVLVMIDWVVIAVDAFILNGDGGGRSGAGSARLVKSVRAMRILRSIRLLRVAKLPSVFKDLTISMGRSEYAGLVFGIIKHLSSILIINHLVACVWFFIGKDNPDGWVKVYKAADAFWQDQYLISLHWSLCQLTPAPTRIQPTNFVERLYTVTVIVFALITFSSFVSSITNLMNQRRMLKSHEAKQFAKLEHYLHDNHISFHLASRVRRFLEHSVYEAKRKPHETNVELIPKLSEPLKQELHLEVHGPVVSKHPFFLNYMHLNLPAMKKLCHMCIREVELSMDDILYNSGELAKGMYFLTNGKLEYTRSCDDHHTTLYGDDNCDEDHVPVCNNWCTEMVLWTPWEHRGMMKAQSQSSLTAIHFDDFHNIIRLNKAGQLEASAYAIEAVRILNERQQTDSTPTDLDGWPFDSSQIGSKIFKTRNKKGHWLRAGQAFGAQRGSVLEKEAEGGHIESPFLSETHNGADMTERLRNSLPRERKNSSCSSLSSTDGSPHG